MEFWKFDILKYIELGLLLLKVTSDIKRNEILRIGYIVILYDLNYILYTQYIYIYCDQLKEIE